MFFPLYIDFFITDFLRGKPEKCQPQACNQYVFQSMKISYAAVTIKEIPVALAT